MIHEDFGWYTARLYPRSGPRTFFPPVKALSERRCGKTLPGAATGRLIQPARDAFVHDDKRPAAWGHAAYRNL
jgi:hypothetical protein